MLRKLKLRNLKHRIRRYGSHIEKWLYCTGLLNPPRLILPDFIGIGAQKAGTTWLYENLRSHPGLYLPDEKELHYFDESYDTPIRNYTKHFSDKTTQVQGEITPGYSIISEERIRFIHALCPGLKVIFLLRNPIDRAWSQARMNLVRFSERSFENVPDEEFYDHFVSPRSVKRGDYRAILSRWKKIFGHDQVYVDFFERVADAPRMLLQDVFNFLGVSVDVNWSRFPFREVIFSNPSRSIPSPFQSFLRNMYYDDLYYLHNEFGSYASEWYRQVDLDE